MRARTDTQTDTQTRVTAIHFASSATRAKCNNSEAILPGHPHPKKKTQTAYNVILTRQSLALASIVWPRLTSLLESSSAPQSLWLPCVWMLHKVSLELLSIVKFLASSGLKFLLIWRIRHYFKTLAHSTLWSGHDRHKSVNLVANPMRCSCCCRRL